MRRHTASTLTTMPGPSKVPAMNGSTKKTGAAQPRQRRGRADRSGQETPAERERTGSMTGPGRFRFGVANYAAFVAGLIAIVLGYVQLDNGSVTAAPLLLIFGYAVLLPLGIVLGWRSLD